MSATLMVGVCRQVAFAARVRMITGPERDATFRRDENEPVINASVANTSRAPRLSRGRRDEHDGNAAIAALGDQP